MHQEKESKRQHEKFSTQMKDMETTWSHCKEWFQLTHYEAQSKYSKMLLLKILAIFWKDPCERLLTGVVDAHEGQLDKKKHGGGIETWSVKETWSFYKGMMQR